MSEETPTNSADVEDVNLDDFAADFFGRKNADPEPASSEVDPEPNPEDDDAPEVDEDNDNTPEDTDTLAEEDEPSDEEDNQDDEDEDEDLDPEPEEKPKKKNRFQERIDELTAKAKEAERRELAAIERINALEAKLNKNDKTDEPKQASQESDDGPRPDDLNEDGTDKYPLGEFDPAFIRDITKHTLKVEREERERIEQEERSKAEVEQVRTQLQESWNEKLGPARERYPDFNEKGEALVSVFDGIDEAYGEYLTSALMSMDHGPDVLYYLSNNVDEAKKIVESGPQKATLSLGYLNGKFADAESEKRKARPKASNAPPPPPKNKGSSRAFAEVPDDTDDLDAFSKKLFSKKR